MALITIDMFLKAITAAENSKKIRRKKYIPIDYNFALVLKLSKSQAYKSRRIPKKNGTQKRLIEIPRADLKLLQIVLKIWLQQYYNVPFNVHAFVRGRGIRSNALPHCNKKSLLNIDLKDFFHSITKNRLIAFLQSRYNMHPDLAVLIAGIACYKGRLPQGSPCSPILSNMVCQKLDNRINTYCGKNNIDHTRFADDLSFSSNKLLFQYHVDIFEKIIIDEGFKLNSEKTRIQPNSGKQEVTGVVTNGKKPNLQQNELRSIRSLLHKTEKVGVDIASTWAQSQSLLDNCKSRDRKVAFMHYLSGKVSHVANIRGSKDKMYLQFKAKLKSIYPPTP